MCGHLFLLYFFYRAYSAPNLGALSGHLVIGQLRSHETNRRRVSDNNNISQLLGDSFSVSQQPPHALGSLFPLFHDLNVHNIIRTNKYAKDPFTNCGRWEG